MLVGGLFGGVKASSLRCSYAVNRPRVEDRVVREKSLSARLTPTRCRLWVASPLSEERRGYPSSASLCVPGETLGPVRWSGQQRLLSFLKVLLGTRRFGGTSSEGAAVVGHRSLVNPSMSPFSFFFSFSLGVCLLLPQHSVVLCLYAKVVSVIALFIKRGESLFRLVEVGLASCVVVLVQLCHMKNMASK